MSDLRLIMLAIGLSLASWVAQADAPDGIDLLEDTYPLATTKQLLDVCGAGTPGPGGERVMAFCTGYVTGAMQYHRALAGSPDTEPIICPEDQFTRHQLLEVFLEWARQNAQHWDEPPVQGVLRAASEAWPCQR